MLQKVNIGMNWERLFSVHVRNNFYQDGTGKDFEFAPSNKTLLLLKKYKLLYKKGTNGFSIFCNIEQFLRIMQSSRIKKNKISFLIKSKNSFLTNYTDLSFQDTNKIFYFNNLNKNIKSNMNLLHENEFMSESKKIKIYSRIQTIRLDKLDTNTALLDSKKSKVDRETWWGEHFGNQNIMLRNLEEGKYSIQNGKQQDDFYIIDYIKEPVWGILDIYLDDIPKEYSFIEKGAIKPIDYHINMNARRTFWKYFIIGDNKEVELKLEDVKITYNGEAIAFTKPVKTTLTNGVKAFMIESVKDMELKEVTHVTDKLELKIKSNGKWKSKSIKLPKPSIKMVKPDRTADKVYSTSYVYV